MTQEHDHKGKETIYFIYDGECPICQMGAGLYRPRQSVGTLQTVDARTEKQHPVLREVNDAGLNLDDGMVIKYDGKLYHGQAALRIMAQLGADVGLFNRINNVLGKSEVISRITYPMMRTGRNLLLRLLGRENIQNLVKK